MTKGTRIKLIITAALVLISAACVIAAVRISSLLPLEKEYERWRGDNEMEFSQVSCFVPESDRLDVTGVNTFRNNMVEGFSKASLDISGKLFVDCYSASGSCQIATDKANTKASVLAVGGEFFDFHLYEFTDGTYFSENSTLSDNVILDEELAWFLFGATEVVGSPVNINGQVFYVSGVIKREQDFASREAYNGGMGLILPLASYQNIAEDSVYISCYEVVLPNPVRNFAINLVQEKFPAKNSVIQENTGRFSFESLIKVIRNSSKRTMSASVPYPYWENSARYAESRAAKYLFAALLALLYPVIFAVSLIVRLFKKAKTKAEDDVLPDIKEKAEEQIRVRQRKRWEKAHPGQK